MAKSSKTQPDSESRTAGVDLHEVERVLEFMQKHGLEEFEYERNGLRIRLKKPSVTHGSLRAVPSSEIVIAAAPSAGSSGTAAGTA